MKRSPEQEDGTFAKKHRRLPPLSETACPDEHVFISLDGYDAKVKTLFDKEGGKVVFIRAGVATGKTTLAAHLARQFPNKYIMVPFTEAGEESAWQTRTVEAIKKSTGDKFNRDELTFGQALQLAAESMIGSWSTTRLTHFFHHKSYAQHFSRAAMATDRRSCYSQPQGRLRLNSNLWLHPLKSAKSSCGQRPSATRRTSGIS